MANIVLFWSSIVCGSIHLVMVISHDYMDPFSYFLLFCTVGRTRLGRRDLR